MLEKAYKNPECDNEDGTFTPFRQGDLVKLRQPFPETSSLVGAVLFIENEWVVHWSNGEVENFDYIAGDDLIIISSINRNTNGLANENY